MQGRIHHAFQQLNASLLKGKKRKKKKKVQGPGLLFDKIHLKNKPRAENKKRSRPVQKVEEKKTSNKENKKSR